MRTDEPKPANDDRTILSNCDAPRRPRVLINCEFSGIVREAFRARGHDAWSCDLLPAEDGSPYHIEGDALHAMHLGWDLMIAHPPCTFLANSSSKHLYAGMKKENGPNPERWARMGHAALFFKAMLEAPIKRIAVENPIMLGHPKRLFDIPDQTQTIQPWQFGHGETKATCLWLINLPNLEATNIVSGRTARVHKASPGPDRWKERSRTLTGIAEAMAEQWGSILLAEIMQEQLREAA